MERLLEVVFDKILPSIYIGILWLTPLVGVLAVILGHLAWASIRSSAGRFLGKGMATGGLVLGYLGVVGWIVIVFFIVPAIDRSLTVSDEASGVGSLRTINTAVIVYSATYGGAFPPTLAALGPPKTENANTSTEPSEKAAGLIDEVLASGMKSGYRFTYIPGPTDSKGKIQAYTIHAGPIKPDVNGNMHYFTDQTGVIRVEKGKEASENSPHLQ